MSQPVKTAEKKGRFDHLIYFFQKRRSEEKYALIIIFFGLLVFGIYFQTINAPFAFDDAYRIQSNSDIHLANLAPGNIIRAGFKSSKTRPVAFMTLALNYYFGQYDPAGYHIVNMLIHFLTGFFLFLFIRATFKTPALRGLSQHSDLIAFLSAVIWLSHPVQTQSVTYIIQRMTSMASMLFVFSFWSYTRGRLAEGNRKKWLWYSGAILGWLVSLGCKQITVTLPLLVIIYEWYFFQDLSKNWFKRCLKWILGVAALIAIIALLYTDFNPLERFSRFRDLARDEFTVMQRALTQPRVVIYYISLLFYPHPSRLNLDYDFPLSYSLVDPFTTLLSLITILVLVLLSVYLAKGQRLISFCILWFFGNLVIESSVIPLALIFEHRLYLPSMLVSLLLVVVIHRYIKPRWLSVAIACSLVLLLSYWAFERNKVWQDGITLWADVIKKSPHKARPYSNLAYAQAKQNMPEEAIKNYLKAIELDPNFFEAHYNLGEHLEKQGKPDEAIQYFGNALRINPKHVRSHNHLGMILLKQDKTPDAIDHFRKALQINPDFPKAHNNLGIALAKDGKHNEAVEHYQKALKSDPDFPEAHFNLGAALAKDGKLDEAVEHYQKALQSNPDLPEAHLSLGNALMEQGKTEEGLVHIQKAVQLKPDYVEAHNNLGGYLLGRGEIDEARKHFIAVLKIDPNMPQAHNNMGIIMINKGKINEAIFHFQEAVRSNPEFEQAQNNLQRAVAIQQNQMDMELEKTRTALKDNPSDPQLNYELGNLYLAKGDLKAAIDQFQKALSLQPDFPEALNNLAMAHTFNRQYAKALVVFQKLVALQPANPANYYNIAVLHALLKNVNESLVWLNKAVAMGYDNWDLIKTDKDLDNIRNSEGYRELVKGR